MNLVDPHQIPDKVIEAERTLTEWASENNWKAWRFGGVAERRELDAVERKLQFAHGRFEVIRLSIQEVVECENSDLTDRDEKTLRDLVALLRTPLP